MQIGRFFVGLATAAQKDRAKTFVLAMPPPERVRFLMEGKQLAASLFARVVGDYMTGYAERIEPLPPGEQALLVNWLEIASDEELLDESANAIGARLIAGEVPDRTRVFAIVLDRMILR